MLRVADLSNHNNSNLSNYPADAYIFKITEGNYFLDKNCASYVQQAKAMGKPYGFYHFMDNGSSAQAQAEFFVSKITPYIGEALLVLDYEMYGRLGTNQAKVFLDYVYNKTGVKPLVYCSESVTHEENWSQVVAGNYGLWVAKYSSNKPNVKYWPFYAMWQYTSTPYDLSEFYGTIENWKSYAKSNKSNVQPPTQPPTQPSTGKKSLETLASEVESGKHGTGEHRKKLLGNYYTGVQAIINHRAKVNSAHQTVSILKNETLKGLYGNGNERKELLGTYYTPVQKYINEGL